MDETQLGTLALVLLPVFFGATIFLFHRWMRRMEGKVDVLLDPHTGVFVQLARLRAAIEYPGDSYEGPRRRVSDKDRDATET